MLVFIHAIIVSDLLFKEVQLHLVDLNFKGQNWLFEAGF
jgi:hypothetical protein